MGAPKVLSNSVFCDYDLKGLFQPERFYDSMIKTLYKRDCGQG